ncbi:MAG: O-antigen ligase family protein [Gammaproteobacteria bacterium]|nr:O-antigen ligase family protein [Gammaproteobacteria bacterium]MDH3411538.1 O-antigen ligase family protein [Gammaproteobacteria bacterium]
MYSATAFLIFCAACTVLAFVRHPIYGFYFYLASTYVFPPARWWSYMLGDETRWSLMAAGVTVLAVLLHRGKLQPKPVWLASVPAIVFATYAAWMWIQFPWALDPNVHFRGSLQYAKYLVAFWFVYRIVDTKERVRDVLLAHMLGCTLLGIFAYVMGRQGDRLDGVGGPGMDEANTLGMYFATGAIVGLGLLLTQAGWRRWLSLGCIAIIMNGLVLTNTRGAFLGLVAGGLVMALFKAKTHRRRFWVLAVVGLLGVASIVDQKFIDRMSTIENVTSETEADTSAEGRFVLLEAQVQMFVDYPMGTGHRGTELLSRHYLDKKWLSWSGHGARASHNTFMTTLVEQGIPGAVLFVWLTLWTLLAMLRLRRLEVHLGANLTTLAVAIVSALAAIFVAGNTADFLLAEVQFWLFATLVSILRFAAMGSTGERPVASGAMPRQSLT